MKLPLPLPEIQPPSADGWLFSYWLLQDDGQHKLGRLRANLQQAARSCSLAAEGAERARASDLVCAAWAADLASRLVQPLRKALLDQSSAVTNTSPSDTAPTAPAPAAQPVTSAWLDSLLNTFMDERSNLAPILEEIGHAAFWAGRSREGAALINGAGTLRGGALNGAMAEAAAWLAFGHSENARETLRCATEVLSQGDPGSQAQSALYRLAGLYDPTGSNPPAPLTLH